MAETLPGSVSLSRWIKQLRAELEEATGEGVGKPIRFVVGPVELDLEVVTSVSAEAQAEVKFWVVTVGGGGSGSRTATQRIHLTLTPKTADGAEVEVVNERHGPVPE